MIMMSEVEFALIYNDENPHLLKRVLFITLDMNIFTSSSELGQCYFEI